MTTKQISSSDLLGLVERIEGASGPDRELDKAIQTLVDGFVHADYLSNKPFTASLDAAMMLVPKDSWIEIKGPRKYLNIPTPVPATWSAEVSRWNHEGQGIGWAATPALALCAAAIRARASLTNDGAK